MVISCAGLALRADDISALPILDRAIATLIEDLYTRGLDKKVLLVVTGEDRYAGID